ncbi:hypothetical protein DFP77_12833 [Marinomonas foliarum]|uniref:Uncharacterized protein n=1 Tax=Marinomonas foliarum TaxID=491950 RepID=A0A368ZQQ3_9GAMM|nr:hypothetical protein DFP77_12833 [Marinomonas foliarum]
MKLSSYMKSWGETQNEKKWSHIFIVGLIVAIIVLSLILTNKKRL